MSDAGSDPRMRRLAIIAVYAGAFLQGLTLVSFPASAAVLTSGLGLGDAQYGAIYLPQVVFAVAGAVGGGAVARRVGIKALLAATLVVNGLSQVCLAASLAVGHAAGFPVILAGTSFLGLAFGIGGAPLNSYPPLLFPHRRDSAIVALHTLLGLGMSAGPLLTAGFIHLHAWAGLPLVLAAATLGLAAVARRKAFPACEAAARERVDQERPLRSLVFWGFVAAALLYAVAEGTFSNWVVLYLQQAKGLPATVAGLALSVFWGAIVVGRLLVSVLVLRLPAQRVWLTLPAFMAVAFLLLPYATTPARGLGLFAAAGLACSAFFPLTVDLVAERFPDHRAWASSMMIGAAMAGVGLGSYAIGPLRHWLSFEALYRLSSLYPVAVFLVARAIARTAPAPTTLAPP
jgi:fucose permease